MMAIPGSSIYAIRELLYFFSNFVSSVVVFLSLPTWHYILPQYPVCRMLAKCYLTLTLNINGPLKAKGYSLKVNQKQTFHSALSLKEFIKDLCTNCASLN